MRIKGIGKSSVADLFKAVIVKIMKLHLKKIVVYGKYHCLRSQLILVIRILF